ncbi:MAG: hypothetical protein CML68_13535 [Rhodobacteraceae bacterium]|nr:hypothetical protein [Paracoccaceae bacterium]
MTEHWKHRVTERIGCVDPKTLWDAVQWAVANDRDDLAEFVCRVSKTGRRLFRIKVPPGRVFFVLINTDTMTPITVMPPGFRVNRQGKRAMVLRDAS